MGRMLFVATFLIVGVAVGQTEPAPAPAEQPAAPVEAKPADPKPVAPAAKAPEAGVAAEPKAPPAPPESKPAASKPTESKAAAAPAPAPRQAVPRLPPDGSTAANPSSPTFGLSDQDAVAYEARLFFLDILSSDARSLTDRASFPFYLEDRRFDDDDALFTVWLKNMRQKRTDLLTLYGVEVLSPADMEKKYGRPPARLAQFPYKGNRTWVAVANLSGRPAVVVYRNVNNRWKAVGYHD